MTQSPLNQHDQNIPIRVKFISRHRGRIWNRYFPDGIHHWGNCTFIFDYEEKDYDWLVVYEDLPASQGEYRPMREEILPCPQSNTILLTTEPPTIKAYGSAYTHQFGWVLTSQPDWALPHPNRIYTQQAMHWHYGCGTADEISYDQMVAEPPTNKNRNISTVCSAKQQKHTLHNKRYAFTQELKQRIPELEIYGRGVREVADKAEAIDAYRYHLAIENFIDQHHLTEKLTDVFLGGALPFYCGCPNAAEYFPEQSFIPLDLNDVEGAAKVIKNAIENNEYEKRLPFIMEARRRVLDEYSVIAITAREIEARNKPYSAAEAGGSICSRWLLLKRSPAYALKFIYEKYKLRFLCKLFANK